MKLKFYQESLKTIKQISTIISFRNAKDKKLQNKINNYELPEENNKAITTESRHRASNLKSKTSLLESKKTINSFYHFKNNNHYDVELYFDFLQFELSKIAHERSAIPTLGV